MTMVLEVDPATCMFFVDCDLKVQTMYVYQIQFYFISVIHRVANPSINYQQIETTLFHLTLIESYYTNSIVSYRMIRGLD